jgi:hypothetical protein
MSAPSGAASGEPDDTSQAGNEGDSLPPLSSDNLGTLANKLGINPAVRARMNFGEAAPAAKAVVEETESETDDDAGESDEGEAGVEGEDETTVEGEAEGDTEAAAEDEDEDEDDKKDEGKPPDISKLETKVYKQRKRAQRAEKALTAEQARVADLQAQLEKASPIVVTPSVQDPLAAVTDLDSLERQKVEFRTVRDKARANPRGWVENEGKENERVVDAKEAAWWLGYTEDVLTDHFPRKEKEIREVRPNAINEARRIMPTLFDKGTEDYQAAQLVMRNYPWVAASPEREYLLAVFLKGWKQDLIDQAAARKGNGKAPAAILKAHNDKGKVPKLKHAAPSRSTQAESPKGEGMANVFHDHIKTGGTREGLIKGLKALRGLEGPKARSAAPV